MRKIDRDELLWKLHACVKPILAEIASKIAGYKDDKLQRIAAKHFAEYKDVALRLKKAGLTDEETVDRVARNLARQKVIKPKEEAIAQVFRSLPDQDAEVKAFLERDQFTKADYGRLLSGDFMEKHRYGPLQEKMKELLKPHVAKNLAPVLAQANSATARLKNLFSPIGRLYRAVRGSRPASTPLNVSAFCLLFLNVQPRLLGGR